MGLTTSMNTALSGLNASQQELDVVGNNIANVNTTAYKGSRTIFQTQLSQTASAGTPSTETSGGTNPTQIGMGVGTGIIQKDMSTGSIETTGLNSDAAIQGSGFFVLQDASGDLVYSRDGAFQLDSSQTLVSASGNYVMGYAVDDKFNILEGTLSEISIPLGQLSVAQATENVYLQGNLDSGIDTDDYPDAVDENANVATDPGVATSEELVSIGSGLDATETTLLTDLATAENPSISIFAVGDVITLDAAKGGANLATATFTVTNSATSDVDSGSTVAEYLEWLETHMSLDPSAPQATPAGATIVDGQIILTGNLGIDNVPSIKMSSDGSVMTPFIMTTETPDTIGVGASTTFLAYDSLGNQVSVNINFALVDKGDGVNTWQFYVDSTGDSDASDFLGTGTISFDADGNYLSSTGNTVTLNRAGTGATDPITMTLDFSDIGGFTGESGVYYDTQDGRAAGTLTDYTISTDGQIIGSFSNGVSKTLGQIVLANFSNPDGLIAQENNTYIAGANSGEGSLVTPGENGTGTLIGGALELSNVDITGEFINMVSASTAFSAAGKVITTAQSLLDELMNIVR